VPSLATTCICKGICCVPGFRPPITRGCWRAVARLGGETFQQYCFVFSTVGQLMKPCAPLPTGRSYLGVTAWRDTVYAVGGYAAQGWDFVEAFNTTSSQWTSGLASMLTPRYGLTVQTVGNSVRVPSSVAPLSFVIHVSPLSRARFTRLVVLHGKLLRKASLKFTIPSATRGLPGRPSHPDVPMQYAHSQFLRQK
jgi:hypothetical protein